MKQTKRYQDQNVDLLRKKSKERYKNNSAYYINKAQKRHAQRLNATIPGYDKDIYEVFKETKRLEKQDGIKREVHHIIPLQENPNMSGLHVPWNLEILTKEDHILRHKELKKALKKC